MTNVVSRMVWAAFFAAAGRRGRAKRLEYAGQCVLLAILLTWVLCLWMSLFLMLASAAGSVVDDSSGAAADLWETFYYAGFTLSTLGVGDYSAAGNGWRVLTSAAAFCGLIFITAAITYFVPVLSAVSLQNQLSLLISSMGRTPQEILINSWNGEDFSSFYDNASDIRQMLVEHTLNHHSYPVIRCFHNSDASKNVIPAIATLGEVLWLLDSVATDIPQDGLKRRMLESALDDHLEMQHSSRLAQGITDSQRGPVDLAPLVAAGIALADDQAASNRRRAALGRLLDADGWRWEDVYGNAAE